MEISVDNTSNMSMKIVSITEILLQTPMLNMIVVNAKINHNAVNFTEQCDSGKLVLFIFHYDYNNMPNVFVKKMYFTLIFNNQI